MKNKLINIVKQIFNYEFKVPSFKIHIGSILIGMIMMFCFNFFQLQKSKIVHISKEYVSNRDRFLKL